MKTPIALSTWAAMMLATSLVHAADIADGTVLAFDRKAQTLVFSDKTVWSLEGMTGELPANLKAGDRVRIQYESDEDGLASIGSIIILSIPLPTVSQAGAQDTADGTVLALDRKAKTLIFTDKTVWPLGELTSPLPANLKAGDRVEIQYESDEDGVTTISSIRILAQ